MALTFSISIEGKQQGKFKGDSKRKDRPDAIDGLAFSYEVQTPVDTSSGQATGRRRHAPVMITKAWGPATPQLFQALFENEVLRSVLIEFYRQSDDGSEEIYQTVKLSNAKVSAIRQHTSTLSDASSALPELEDVSFTFGRIEINNLPGKTIADDDWMTARE